MGLLDGIGLVVLILVIIACCSYCYRCCCGPNPIQQTESRPRRNRRQKNARRKRRRRQHSSRTPSTIQDHRPPNHQSSVTSPLQCNVDIYSEQPQPVVMYPQYQQPQGHQPFQQVHPYVQGQPYQQFQAQPYPQYSFQSMNLPADQAMLSPPPYESHQGPQGQFQNFGVPSQNFFPQVPPPPYDTQLSPHPIQPNSQSADVDKKS